MGIRMRSVWAKTLHDLRGQFVGWSLGLAFLAASNVVFFPHVGDLPEMEGLLKALPQGLQNLIGDPSVMTQIEGFLKVKLFDALPLVLAVFAASQGASIVAGEIERGTMDLLLAQPVGRWRVVIEKFAALVTVTFAMILVMLVALLVSAGIGGIDLDRGWILRASLNVVPITLVFAALALLGACWLHRTRPAATIAGGLAFAGYFWYAMALANPSLMSWRRLSLNSLYVDSLPLGGSLQPGPFLGLMGMAVVLLGLAVWAFEKRDVTG